MYIVLLWNEILVSAKYWQWKIFKDSDGLCLKRYDGKFDGSVCAGVEYICGWWILRMCTRM